MPGSPLRLYRVATARPGVDRATVELALLGLIVLAAGAARGGAVPGWGAAVFGLGVLMVGIEAGVQDNAYFIVSACVLLAGGAAMAVGIWRLDDTEFGAGGRA